jgi:hypothetical protein
VCVFCVYIPCIWFCIFFLYFFFIYIIIGYSSKENMNSLHALLGCGKSFKSHALFIKFNLDLPFFILKYVKPFIFVKLYKGNQIKLLAFKVFSSQLLISLQLYIGSQNFTFVAHMVSMGLWQVLGSNLTRIKKQRFSHLFNIVSIAVPTISVKLPRIGRAPMLCSIWPIC